MPNRLLKALICFLCLFSISAGQTWTQRFLSNVGTLRSVTWSPEHQLYVTVGDGPGGSSAVSEGRIFTSRDAVTWTSQGVQSANLYSVAAGQGRFVTVGKGGLIRTSEDGVTWVTRVSGTTGSLWKVAWIPQASDSAHWIACGDGGLLLTSLDGVTWKQRTSSVSGSLRTLTWIPWKTAPGSIVALGVSGAMVTSLDGISWTPVANGSSQSFYGLAYGDSIAVAVGGAGAYITSKDGVAWVSGTGPSSNGLMDDVNWASPDQGGLGFLASVHVGYLFSSPDGKSWTKIDPVGTAESFVNILWTGSRYVLVGLNGRVLTTPSSTPAPTVAPTLLSPADSATGLSIPVQLKWNATNNKGSYDVQVFSSDFVNYTDKTVGLDTSTSVTTFGGKVDYFWRVRERNESGTGPWSVTRKFSIQNDTITVVSVLNGTENDFSLITNDPAHVRFTLSATHSRVQLDMINMKGQVLHLIDGPRNAGLQEVAIPGVPAGLYTYRLRVGNQTITRRVALVR